jgi:hypothetical protein
MERDPLTSSIIKRDARDFAKRRRKSHSALDSSRAAESNEFSEKSQKKFGGNERGAEDVMDMYQKGAFN